MAQQESKEKKFRSWNGKKFRYARFTQLKEMHELIGLALEGKPVNEFSGLKDEKGNEIYEGDILQYPDLSSPKKVIFRSGTFCYELAEGQYHIFDEKNCEIIGNIYKNPELLK